MKHSLEQINKPENNVIKTFDSTAELPERVKNVIDKAGSDYEEYLQNAESKIWQMKNDGIINYIIEAKQLLKEHGSSQIIQSKLNQEEIDIEAADDARLLAFVHILESDRSSN